MNNVYVPRPGMVPVRDGQDNNVTQPSYSVQNPQASAGAAAGGTTGTYGMGTAAKRKKERTEKLSTYGLYTLVYAIFTAFCLYKNARGITFPFFALSTIVYADLCLRRMEGKWQKRDMWYPIAIVLLGVSVFLTEDKQMTGLAKWTIFILIGVYSLHILYATDPYSNSNVDTEGVMHIRTADEFMRFTLLVGNGSEELDAVLENDIDLSGIEGVRRRGSN